MTATPAWTPPSPLPRASWTQLVRVPKTSLLHSACHSLSVAEPSHLCYGDMHVAMQREESKESACIPSNLLHPEVFVNCFYGAWLCHQHAVALIGVEPALMMLNHHDWQILTAPCRLSWWHMARQAIHSGWQHAIDMLLAFAACDPSLM